MFTTKISKSKKLKEIKIIKPSLSQDDRGNIFTFFDKTIQKKLLPKNYFFSHLKIANRKKNVLVGIHYDHKTWKLFACVKGKIFHNVTCLNKENNKEFLKSQSFILDGSKDLKFVLIPPNYGNAFYCYENSVIIYALSYKNSYIDADKQKTIFWKNDKLKIKWPCKNPYLSKRDKFANIDYLKKIIDL
jgi:dTDP-4-dehydrorhamnose 3,5-epimerase